MNNIINGEYALFFKVYKSSFNPTPIVTLSELPEVQLSGKKKYVGKRAKIEAVFRLNGMRLPSEYTTEQINDYIGLNLFNTPRWRNYLNIFKEVREEIEPVAVRYTFQYLLKVVPRKNFPLEPSDDRLLYLITCELMGNPLDNYKGLKNPIALLVKNY